MSTVTVDRPVAPTTNAPPEISPPPAPAAPVRLSDAMRQGARYHPQGRNQLYDMERETTCALGAAMGGLMGPGWAHSAEALFHTFTIGQLIFERTGVDLGWTAQAPPELGGYEQALGTIIIRLNDGYHWSRERIADYLESLGF